MKISEELQACNGYMCFDELQEGDVFLCRDFPENLFMKMEFTPMPDDDARSAVRLSDGKTYCFFDDEPVLPLKVVLELA